jgi:hypothetical protein
MSANFKAVEKFETVVATRARGQFDIVAPGTRMPDGSRVQRKKAGFLGRLLGRS